MKYPERSRGMNYEIYKKMQRQAMKIQNEQGVMGRLVDDLEEHRETVNSDSAFSKQEGGNHYSKLKIQPMEYNLANNMNYGQANAIKYITRYQDKNGHADLRKAIHCLELLMEWENENNPEAY